MASRRWGQRASVVVELASGLLLGSLAGCSAGSEPVGPGEGAEEAALGSIESALLSEVSRCAAGRFDATMAHACSVAHAPRPLFAPGLGISALPRIEIGVGYGVRLGGGSTGAYNGVVELNVRQDGEYTVYLGTPNLRFQISDSTTAVQPTCSRYLPLSPSPAGYGAPCNAELLGGYAVTLRAGVHRLEFGPAANNWVRLVVELRAPAGVTLNSSRLACDLSPTLATACAASSAETPVRGQPFGSSPLSSIGPSSAFGVHLTPVGGVNEGAVSFTPPYTAEYTVYVGTPNVGVRVLDAARRPLFPGCESQVDDTLATQLTGASCDQHIVAGPDHSCAMKGGAVRCWGNGLYGQLGYGNVNTIGDDETPASAGDVNVGGRVVQLAAGIGHTCALLDTSVSVPSAVVGGARSSEPLQTRFCGRVPGSESFLGNCHSALSPAVVTRCFRYGTSLSPSENRS